jgi:F420-dependent oxidoreductase-like protein
VALKIGMHAGPQDLTFEELRRLWQTADGNGFHWVSVWDHFYANPLVDRNNPCFEGVAAMAALAAETRNVRVGCLVFCALFRSPGLLAKAAVTVDHISGGRAALGVGAGWFEEEFREFGYGFPPLGKRLDQLEEALTVIRALLRDGEVSFSGRYYQLDGAVCAPRPVNGELPIWVGGRGRERTPVIAARFADGFNMPYLGPEAVRDRLQRLERACAAERRDPQTIETSVNLGFYPGERTPDVDPRGSLTGRGQELVDRVGEYAETGVGGLNIALRPPVDWEGLEAFIADVMPHFSD